MKLTVLKNQGRLFYGLFHNLHLFDHFFMIRYPFILNPISQPFITIPSSPLISLLPNQWLSFAILINLLKPLTQFFLVLHLASGATLFLSLFFFFKVKTVYWEVAYSTARVEAALGRETASVFSSPPALRLFLLSLLCCFPFILWMPINFPLSAALAAFYTLWYVTFSFLFADW